MKQIQQDPSDMLGGAIARQVKFTNKGTTLSALAKRSSHADGGDVLQLRFGTGDMDVQCSKSVHRLEDPTEQAQEWLHVPANSVLIMWGAPDSSACGLFTIFSTFGGVPSCDEHPYGPDTDRVEIWETVTCGV